METFGRGRELAALRRVVDDTVAGIGGVLVVEGAAGIGKSHLVDEMVEFGSAGGLAVAARAAFSLDRAAPLVTLASALQHCRPSGDAFAWLATVREPSYHTLMELRAALERFTTDRQLIICIDDAHWMDELSALAIRELVPALESSPMRWVFAHRPGRTSTAGRQLIQWLLTRAGTGRLTIGPLDDLAVEQLCRRAVAPDRVDGSILALASGCGGVPLQVEQLMTALRMGGQLVSDRGVASVTGDELPSGFVDLVEQILNGLAEDTRLLLRAGSVFGRPFRTSALAGLVGRPPAQLMLAVDEAVAAGLLTHDDGALRFAHDRVRDAVHDTLEPSVRAALHRDAAEIGQREGRPPVEIADHLLQSGREGAREAVTILRTSARDVSALAPGTAADLIIRALELLGEHDLGRGPLIADAVRLLGSAGRLHEARDLHATALRAGLEPAAEGTLLLGLAEASKHAGQNRDAVDYADQALQIKGIDDLLTAKLLAIRAHALFYAGNLREADRSGDGAAAIGRRSNAAGAAVFGLTARSLVAHAEGRLDASLAFALEATETADRAGGSALHRHPRIWLGSALAAVDRFDEAERTYARGRQESAQLGTAWSEPLWYYYQTFLLIARGRLDEAMAEADAGVAAAERMSILQLAVPLLGALIRIGVLRDDLAQAAEHRTHMHRLIADGITAAPEDIAWADAVLLDAIEGPAAAMPVLTGLLDALPGRLALIAQDPSTTAEMVRIALGAGDRNRAGLVVAGARRLAEANRAVHSLAAAAAHADGVYRADPDRLCQAVEAFRGTPRVLALAAALTDAAANRYAARDIAAAQAYADEALDVAGRTGARRLTIRLERLRGGRPAPATAEDTGPECLRPLTPAERRVAVLVAKGLSNLEVADKLFLSRHTVDSHLRRIFSKLEIKRRADLILMAAEHLGTP